MPTQPRTAQQHYADAERLLAAAESTGTDPRIAAVAALTGIGHALLAAAPRRARRTPTPPARHTGSGSPTNRWLYGDDKEA
jgi:hypothetical protein